MLKGFGLSLDRLLEGAEMGAGSAGMKAVKSTRTCPRCGSKTAAEHCCGLVLTARRLPRWKMSAALVRQVHAVARQQKGLDEETYRLRLSAVGVESCKEFTRKQYQVFMAALSRLPDALVDRRRVA